jgi:thiol-disulfide isomerase/thioredoxin
MKKTVILSIVGIVVVIAVIVYAIVSESKKPGEYDEFATCIAGSGATFFGAFWCPHCLDQKRDFGRSAKLLPYEECSTANRQGQLQVCIDEEIQSYPTWEFADGERLSGYIPMDVLAEKTSCELPVTE